MSGENVELYSWYTNLVLPDRGNAHPPGQTAQLPTARILARPAELVSHRLPYEQIVADPLRSQPLRAQDRG